MMKFIDISVAGSVTTIRLNRPEVLNAINHEMHCELEAAFDSFADDDEQRLCVVTGAGDRAFCAGSDLKAASVPNYQHPPYPRHGYGGLTERFDLNKPIIAAINGLALGGGFEIALACDIIIASDHASFGLPEPKVGAIALAGGVHRLARQIGLKKAMDLILTSRRVSASEGAAMGFVNEVVPHADLAATVQRYCDLVLQGAPLAIRASKQSVMRGLNETSLEQAIQNQAEYSEYFVWRTSDDTKEGPRAFAEKRAPRWRGR